MGSRRTVWRHPAMCGLIAGWVVGMLWWAGLVIAFGPSTIVTTEAGQVVERPISIASRLVYAPLVGLPWAVPGLVVGAATSLLRGYVVPAASLLGTVGGGAHSLMTSPFDGWLVLTMPLSCFAGTFVGLVVGGVLWFVGRTFRGASPPTGRGDSGSHYV